MDISGKRLIIVGHLEGVSFLILLFIAMPLKYMFDMPLPVRIMGSIHGLLFVIFSIVLWLAYKKMPLTTGVAAKIFILSFIPFGTFFIKRMLPEEIDYLNM